MSDCPVGQTIGFCRLSTLLFFRTAHVGRLGKPQPRLVGRTGCPLGQSAADAPVGLFAPCTMLVSSFQMRDEGVLAPRAPRPGGPPHRWRLSTGGLKEKIDRPRKTMVCPTAP